MEGVNFWQELIKLGPVFVLMGVVIWWLVSNRKEMKTEYTEVIKDRDKSIDTLNNELKEYAKDYKELANKSLSVLILVDDKLKSDIYSNETVKDVHRIVQEILEIEKRRSA